MYPIYRKASAEGDRPKGRRFLGYGVGEIYLTIWINPRISLRWVVLREFQDGGRMKFGFQSEALVD